MKLASFEAIVRALSEARVCYLVAGGLAVNVHGYLRLTKVVDIVLQLDQENTLRALAALARLGYQPTVPIEAEQFADAEQRESWVREKNMQVFQLWSEDHRETPIDIFVEEPFGFDEEFSKALMKPLYETIEVRFVSLPTLIRMKEAAGRPQDKIDLDYLRARLKDDAND